MGLSVREVEAVLTWLGVDRRYQAVWNWKEKLAETHSDPPTAEPSRVAVNEKQIKVDGEKLRSRSWHGQFWELTRKCIIHNLTQAAS